MSAQSASTAGGPSLAEAAAIPWRERATQRVLRRDGRRWTMWTSGVMATFTAPAALLVWLEPLAFPAAAFWLGHGLAITHMQAGRGARSVVPLGSQRSAAQRRAADGDAEGMALGLLGDLVGHDQRELLERTGLALHRGTLGVWLIGEAGAILVRWGGRRVDCFCVRVSEVDDLPAGDRVAHLLLALREDERGFATVANLGFSGASWRLRLRLPKRSRPALERARAIARARDAHLER